MERFAPLLDKLATMPSRTGKLALLERYFHATPDPDRGWALAALADGLPMRLPLRRALGLLMADKVDPVLYRLSRDFVGDTAETVALLWPDHPGARGPAPALREVIEAVRVGSAAALAPAIGALLDRLDARGRWALLKLLGGSPRVGVSARLVKTALAGAMGVEVAAIEEAWHAAAPPYLALFAWLEGRGARPALPQRPLFRPMMLAHPIAEPELGTITAAEFAAEWKWDGIRVQIAAAAGEARVFSRTGDDISAAFPEIAGGFAGREATVDGELLVVRDTAVAPFGDLQQRLNRKSVAGPMLARFPAHVRLYDLLLVAGEDVRALPFLARRERLEAWHARAAPAYSDLSQLLSFADLAELARIRGGARAAGIEGVMLKRKASPYIAGRPRGHWYKWKRAALTLDCVLMYAQRGSGKRSSLYSDYTFGVWRQAGAAAPELVPVGKAYSGYTDAELLELDRFVRRHTVESFGPVRAIRPSLVLEVAFDALQASKRHKSGVAMRFPRINRIRWDKPAVEADTLATVLALLEGGAVPPRVPE